MTQGPEPEGSPSPAPRATPLRVLVVDDHEVVREGIVAALDRRENFHVVAQAGTVAEAIAAADRFEPDLVVMDVRLPDGSGVEACRDIRGDHPNTKVVMLTSYPDEEAVLSAIVAGASGYLLKETRLRDLVKALETVGAGGSLLDPAVTGKVLERVRRMANDEDDDELARLTTQERRILLLVRGGQDEPRDRGRGLPVRQDRQELRQLDPVQARPAAADPGRRIHGPTPRAGHLRPQVGTAAVSVKSARISRHRS